MTTPHVVIIGGGFGGLSAARALHRAPVRITLIDRTNHHLFQPLLYQVAMAGLSPADIAAPIRSVLHKQKNVTVLLAEAVGVDFTNNTVRLADGDRVVQARTLHRTGATDLLGPDLPGDLLLLPLEGGGWEEHLGLRATTRSPDLPVVIDALCAHRKSPFRCPGTVGPRRTSHKTQLSRAKT